MIKNRTVICLALLTLVLGIGSGAAAEDKMVFKAPKDGLVIDFIKGNSPRDLSVEFNHSTHAEYTCNECHHKMFLLKGKSAPKSCVTCHSDVDVDSVKGYKSYFKAMHKIRQKPRTSRPACVSCHTTEFGTNNDMTGCATSSCHPTGLH